MPAIAGGLLVVLSVIGSVLALRHRNNFAEVGVERPLLVLLAMALILIFPPAIDNFGYYTTAIVWVPAFIWAAGARSWTHYLIAIVTVLTCRLQMYKPRILSGLHQPRQLQLYICSCWCDANQQVAHLASASLPQPHLSFGLPWRAALAQNPRPPCVPTCPPFRNFFPSPSRWASEHPVKTEL